MPLNSQDIRMDMVFHLRKLQFKRFEGINHNDLYENVHVDVNILLE